MGGLAGDVRQMAFTKSLKESPQQLMELATHSGANGSKKDCGEGERERRGGRRGPRRLNNLAPPRRSGVAGRQGLGGSFPNRSAAGPHIPMPPISVPMSPEPPPHATGATVHDLQCGTMHRTSPWGPQRATAWPCRLPRRGSTLPPQRTKLLARLVSGGGCVSSRAALTAPCQSHMHRLPRKWVGARNGESNRSKKRRAWRGGRELPPTLLGPRARERATRLTGPMQFLEIAGLPCPPAGTRPSAICPPPRTVAP